MWTVLVHAGTLKSGLRLSHNLTEGYCGSALYMFLHRDSEILYVSQVPPCLLKRVQGPGLPPSPLHLTPLCLVSRMELTPSRRMGEKKRRQCLGHLPRISEYCSHFTHDLLRCFQREKNILLNTISHSNKTPDRNNRRKEAFIILAHSAGVYGGKSWLPSTLFPQSGNRKRWMVAPSSFLLFIQSRTPVSPIFRVCLPISINSG